MSVASVSTVAAHRCELLAWAANLGAVTAVALVKRTGIAPASARARLAAAERDGTMRAWRLLHGEPALYSVTREGMRAAQVRGLRPGRVSVAGARHASACCAAAASLALAFEERRVLGEPAVRRWERELGGPLAQLEGLPLGGAGGARHRPDLLLAPRNAAERPFAVEIELTVKAPVRLAAICRAWARSREVSGVLYLAAEDAIAPLARAVASVRGGERIVVLPLSALSEPAARRPDGLSHR